jgi:hypothetical protein
MSDELKAIIGPLVIVLILFILALAAGSTAWMPWPSAGAGF